MKKLYMYDRKNKEELFAATDYYVDANDGEKYDMGCIAHVEDRLPLGLFFCNVISSDFTHIVDILQQSRTDLLQNEFGFSIECFDSLDCDDILQDINVLYLLKVFIDLCNEYPKLFSIDYFYRFHEAVCTFTCYDLPELTGYYADPEDLSSSEILIGRNYAHTDIDGEIDLFATNFTQNTSLLKKILLGPDPNYIDLENKIEVLAVSGIVGAMFASLITLMNEKCVVKKCSLCGKYFVPPNRSDTLYCSRPSPSDPNLTCKEYGSKKLWYDKLKNDEVAKLARNVYSAKQMLVRRNPDILGYKKMFDFFRSERKKWELQIKTGEKTPEEYIIWLNEMKAKKTL